MITYNKLVRDKIPQIIEASGKQCAVRVLDKVEYDLALKAKMKEELEEFLGADSYDKQMEELADLLEVVYSFVQSKGAEVDELEQIRNRKQDERGGFTKQLELLTVTES